jgi:hypothetical protein
MKKIILISMLVSNMLLATENNNIKELTLQERAISEINKNHIQRLNELSILIDEETKKEIVDEEMILEYKESYQYEKNRSLSNQEELNGYIEQYKSVIEDEKNYKEKVIKMNNQEMTEEKVITKTKEDKKKLLKPLFKKVFKEKSNEN